MIENEVESIADRWTREETAKQIAENLLIDGLILHNGRGYEDADSLNISKGSPVYNSLYALKQAVSVNLSRTIDTLEGREIQPGHFGNLGPDSVLPP